MRVELLLLFLVVGAGNYLMRFLPLFWALRRREAEPRNVTGERLGGLLPFVGPSVVVALLVTSIMPETGNGTDLARAVVALLLALGVAVRSGSLGFTVLAGVLGYWLVSLVA